MKDNLKGVRNTFYMDRLLPNGTTIKAANGNSRHTFTPDEDIKLIRIIGDAKTINWVNVSKRMKNRTPRQCRERYKNYLFPKVKTSEFTPEEDQKILEMYSEFGNKWTMMAKNIKGRTPNSIRLRFLSLQNDSFLKKQVINDKVLHQPSNCNTQETNYDFVTTLDSIFGSNYDGTIDLFDEKQGSLFFTNFSQML